VYPTILSSGYAFKIVASQNIDDLQVVVYDLNSKPILSSRIEALHQNMPREVPLSPLAKGFYLVKVQNRIVSHTQKIIIK